MLGHVKIRTAKIWVEVKPQTKKVSLRYWKKSQPTMVSTVNSAPEAGAWYAPVLFTLVNLEMNTLYE